jgi:Uma2 family endonuclease
LGACYVGDEMSGVNSKKSRGGHATLADLLALPEDDRYELIDGELVPKEFASGKHGGTQLAIGSAVIGPFGRRPPGGPPDRPGGWWFATETLIQFAPRQIYRPDIAAWRRERLAALPTEVPITVRPDWVCEVLSPTNTRNDTVRKMDGYHQAEVPHYWLVDPVSETLAVYRWTADGYLRVLGATRGDRVHAEPFHALELSVSAFFGDDDPAPDERA